MLLLLGLRILANRGQALQLRITDGADLQVYRVLFGGYGPGSYRIRQSPVARFELLELKLVPARSRVRILLGGGIRQSPGAGPSLLRHPRRALAIVLRGLVILIAPLAVAPRDRFLQALSVWLTLFQILVELLA